MSVKATLATWGLTKKQVTSSEKLFLLSCADRAGESHECWPSIKRLCENTGMDRKTIIKVRQSVVDKGLLVYTGRFEGRTGLIPVMQLTYVDESSSEFSVEHKLNSPKNGTGNGTKSGTLKQSQKRDTEPKRIEPKKEPNNIVDFDKSPNEKLKPYQKDERFMRFYSIYPKKEKPNDAWKAFKALKPSDELLSAIIDDVKQKTLNHTQWQEKQYIPQPGRYLRSGDFETEVLNLEHERNQKKIQQQLETQKRLAEQEKASQKIREHEQNKHVQATKDALLFRNIEQKVKAEISVTASSELSKMKDALGR